MNVTRNTTTQRGTCVHGLVKDVKVVDESLCVADHKRSHQGSAVAARPCIKTGCVYMDVRLNGERNASVQQLGLQTNDAALLWGLVGG